MCRRGRRGHAPERPVSLNHLQRSSDEANHIECSLSEIVADKPRMPIERVPVHRPGKTHLAVALGVAAVERGLSTTYFRIEAADVSRRGHAPERSVSLIHLQRSAAEAHHIECSRSGIVADESRMPIERVPVHCRLNVSYFGSFADPRGSSLPYGTEINRQIGTVHSRRARRFPTRRTGMDCAGGPALPTILVRRECLAPVPGPARARATIRADRHRR